MTYIFVIMQPFYPQLTKKDGLFTRSTKEQAQKAERKLICVPLIFVILRSWGTIRFLLLIAKGPDYKSQVDDWLLVLQVSIIIFLSSSCNHIIRVCTASKLESLDIGPTKREHSPLIHSKHDLLQECTPVDPIGLSSLVDWQLVNNIQ